LLSGRNLGGGAKRLNAGEGLFIAAGKTAALRAGGNGPSTFLHFLLAPAGDLDRPAGMASTAVTELYRTADPIPGLMPGGYDLNLTRVIFPAGMPSNAPHWLRRHQTNEFDQDRRMIPYARFPIGTTFPSFRGNRDTTAALARSSKAVAMYFA
jgi:hypothetical protein